MTWMPVWVDCVAHHGRDDQDGPWWWGEERRDHYVGDDRRGERAGLTPVGSWGNGICGPQAAAPAGR